MRNLIPLLFIPSLLLAGCGGSGSSSRAVPAPEVRADSMSIGPVAATVTWSYRSTFEYPMVQNSPRVYTYLGESPPTVQFRADLPPSLAAAGVKWSVSGGGTIDSNGVYCAASGNDPRTKPIKTLPLLHNAVVTATSVAAPNVKATATVTYARSISYG